MQKKRFQRNRFHFPKKRLEVERMYRNYPHLGLAFEAFLFIMREARLGAVLTQKQLAERCGTDEKTIAEFEAGNGSVSAQIYEKIKEVLLITFIIDPDESAPIPEGGVMVEIGPRSHLN